MDILYKIPVFLITERLVLNLTPLPFSFFEKHMPCWNCQALLANEDFKKSD
jgi:hypothetical protein